MSALLKKEIRLLLPSFGVALLITLSLWLAPSNASVSGPLSVIVTVFAFLLCPAVVVMMALDSFGREMSSGTFSHLLAQPVSRSRVWWTKTIVLAGALTVVLSAWWLSFLVSQRHALLTSTDSNLNEIMIGTVLIPLAAFSGGLWTVLLFRQVAAAFWFTVIVPAALAMIAMYFTEKYGDVASLKNNLILVLVAYSIAGFFWARRIFLRAQDTQWTGGTIAMPDWLKLPRLFVRKEAKQGRHLYGALLTKEFQLHQSQLVIAGVLALLHLGMIGGRRMGEGFKESSTLEFLTGQFWVLWIVMPLLLGCAAVAEERKLGMLETQLCLPARRRTQFVIKFFVVLGLSIAFGVIIPVLFEGQRILPDLHFGISREMREFCAQTPYGMLLLMALKIVETISPFLPFLPQFAIVTGVAAISFYASTLARNTLQALAPAVLGIVVASILVIGGSEPETVLNYPLWRGRLVYLIGGPVLTFTLAWLMYWNFKRVLIGWPVWRRNAILIFASLTSVIAVATTVYHRAWQKLTPLEPPHGTVRLISLRPTTMKCNGDTLTVQLPDGRVWSSRLTLSAPNLTKMLSGDWKVAEMLRGGRFLEGTNWASVAQCFRAMVGVQKDGSLWVLENPEVPLIDSAKGQSSKPNPTKLVRLGQDNNWKRVLPYSAGAILLKADGTLWRLGPIRFDWKGTWPGLHTFEPQRLGTDSDWVEISSALDDRTAFYKADGRVWMFSKVLTSDTEKISLDGEIIIYRATDFDRQKSVNSAWASARNVPPFQVGVREDGTFRVIADWGPFLDNKNYGLRKQNVQLGKESDWLAVAGNYEVVVTLKADGSLWKWNFPDDPVTKRDTASATLLSTHSDWVAIAEAMGGVVSLATDGTLWFWQFDPRRFYPSEHTFQPLLAASRKPQKIVSIFKEAK